MSFRFLGVSRNFIGVRNSFGSFCDMWWVGVLSGSQCYLLVLVTSRSVIIFGIIGRVNRKIAYPFI